LWTAAHQRPPAKSHLFVDCINYRPQRKRGGGKRLGTANVWEWLVVSDYSLLACVTHSVCSNDIATPVCSVQPLQTAPPTTTTASAPPATMASKYVLTSVWTQTQTLPTGELHCTECNAAADQRSWATAQRNCVVSRVRSVGLRAETCTSFLPMQRQLRHCVPLQHPAGRRRPGLHPAVHWRRVQVYRQRPVPRRHTHLQNRHRRMRPLFVQGRPGPAMCRASQHAEE